MPRFFTEYKYAQQFIEAETAAKVQSLKANRGLSDLLGFGLAVVGRRLAQNPKRYRDYGPYWWAVKELLVNAGLLRGKQSDPLVLSEYRYPTPLQTLVAAEVFRDDYLARFIIGTSDYVLNAAIPEVYILFDSDMEAMLPVGAI